MNIHAPIKIIDKWGPPETAELERLWQIHGGMIRKIARAMGRTTGSVASKSRRLSLHFHGGKGKSIQANSIPARQGFSIFRRRVRQPDHAVLKSGDNQRKLGRGVSKGPWRDFPIFSLTLEERATCPRDCALWLSCYGNGMNWAARYQHGPALEREIAAELANLQANNPRGFVVRLHILGDFYSMAYVDFWRRMLAQHSALHVFGYTARQTGTPIGDMIAHLRRDQWDRFAVRTSGATNGPRAIVVETANDAPAGTIMCPAQVGKTKNCSTCGLCWASQKPIAFLRH